MYSNASDVEKRVTRYWYSDGIGELIGGVMFILLGLYFAAQEFMGQNSMVSVMLQVSLALLMIGGAFLSRRLVAALKARLTYPRTGYVEYQVNESHMKWRRVWVIAIAFVVSALSMVFVRTFEILDSIVAVTGVVVGLAWSSCARSRLVLQDSISWAECHSSLVWSSRSADCRTATVSDCSMDQWVCVSCYQVVSHLDVTCTKIHCQRMSQDER